MIGKPTKQIQVLPSSGDNPSEPTPGNESGATESPDYHPYIDEIEVGSVFSKIDKLVTDNEEDYQFMKIRVPFTFCAWISACLGIFIVFFGGAYTIAFQSVKRRFWLEIIGFILCVPILLWFCYIFCSSSEERRRRKNIFKNRKVRLEVYVKNPEILKVEAKQRVKERVEKDQKEKEDKLKEIELEKKRNPLRYPNKNVVTRKKLPD